MSSFSSNLSIAVALTKKRKFLDRLTIFLVVVWIGFLLFIGKHIQPAEHLALIQAYSKNLGILLLDKVSCVIWENAHSLIQIFWPLVNNNQ